MKLNIFRLIVAFCAFFIGITAFYIWFVESNRKNDKTFLDSSNLSINMPNQKATSDGFSADDYEVYSTFISYAFKESSVIVVDQTSVGLIFDGFDFRIFSGLTDETIFDFHTKKDKNVKLNNNFKTESETIVVSESEIKGIFDTYENGWAEIRKKYPNSNVLISFSRVGFNTARTQAVVFAGISCGMFCNRSKMIFLTKTDEKWTIQKIELLADH